MYRVFEVAEISFNIGWILILKNMTVLWGKQVESKISENTTGFEESLTSVLTVCEYLFYGKFDKL